MKQIIIWGCGKIGKAAAHYYIGHGENVYCYIDNRKDISGTRIGDIPVYLPEYLLSVDLSLYDLRLALNKSNQEEVINQLSEMGISQFEICNERKIFMNRERIISYSHPSDREDVILYNVLQNEPCIFYIDVGSNDPYIYSVTKLFYDQKNAHGINIEPLPELIRRINNERPRDINLCMGAGSAAGTMKLFVQGGEGGLSSVVESLKTSDDVEALDIPIGTLQHVCEQYAEDEIHFLKIDVEGFEYEVLSGMDLHKYRPWIIVMESTYPGTRIPCYEKWESILLSQKYHFAFAYGVNRYYVADEKGYLDERFIPMDSLEEKYYIRYACLE